MKNNLKMLLVFVMSLSVAACSKTPTQNTQGAKAGTYTATSQGMNDLIEVSVEVDDKSIIDVKVVKDAETPGIGSALINSKGEELIKGGKAPTQIIPEEIVKYQSLNVDNVTGATITSAAIKSAVKDCLTQAGFNPDDFNKEVEYENISEINADVVVVGGGGAGLASAVAAAQNGASVVIIEKNGSVGGDTLVCGAIYNSPYESLQSKVEMSDSVKETIEKALAETPINDAHKALITKVKEEWDKYKADKRTDLFDSTAWYTLQTWINGDKVANLDLVKVLCENSTAGLDWLKELGMEFNDKITQGAGSLWQRTHTSTMKMGTGFISTYVDYINSSDKITVIPEATAKNLIKDDSGKVVGVKCLDNKSNKEFEVKANMGVVLSTGGFAANAKMVQSYNTSGKWQDLSKTMTTNRFSSSQGDGITMALEVNSSLTDMDMLQLLYLGNIKDGLLNKFPVRNANGTDQIIFVNKDGKRFVREDGRRDEICLGVLAQKDGIFYIIESADGAGYKDVKDPSWRSADGFTFEYMVNNGYIVTGETLEELAKNLDVDYGTLKETVDKFNESVESGHDEFNRSLYSTKLENGPWVATPRQACMHHTMGGVTIDTSTRVLDTNGKVIEGLYAAGEVTGGIHGGNRLGGNAVVDTVVFGKLAGETVVKDNK